MVLLNVSHMPGSDSITMETEQVCLILMYFYVYTRHVTHQETCEHCETVKCETVCKTPGNVKLCEAQGNSEKQQETVKFQETVRNSEETDTDSFGFQLLSKIFEFIFFIGVSSRS